jgi:hypothetical protein
MQDKNNKLRSSTLIMVVVGAAGLTLGLVSGLLLALFGLSIIYGPLCLFETQCGEGWIAPDLGVVIALIGFAVVLTAGVLLVKIIWWLAH